MLSKAAAKWEKGLKDGNGVITTQSGVLDDVSYSFHDRFEDGKGTTPEELIASAHAACFSMALSNEISKTGMTPGSVETQATVKLEMLDDGPTVTSVHLDATVHIPGGNEDDLAQAANAAKIGCPISKLLNAEITLKTTLTT